MGTVAPDGRSGAIPHSSVRIAATLQRNLAAAGIRTVVGGSALLASLGLTDRVRDWDLITDTTPESAQRALADLGHRYRRLGPNDVFSSAAAYCFEVNGVSIDLIVQFTIDTSTGPVRIPATPGATWRGLTMARPHDWALAYALMGRSEQAAALTRLIENR